MEAYITQARVDWFRLVGILMVGLLIALAGHVTCHAETVSLSWDPNTDTNLAGYKVYYQADTSSLPFSGTGATEGASPLDVHSLTTATLSGLDPNKTYYFAVTAYDTTGVESAYSNIVTVAESVAPTVAITSPAANAAISGTVSVTAGASDNVGVTKVEFYLNGTLQTTDTATPYVYSLNTAALASGTYTLMARAYDAAGNVGQSSTVAVTVVNDTTAPVVALTAPGANATVSGAVAITASASDNVGVSKVEFYQNGVLLYAGNVAPFSYNWDTTSVANGSYTLQARAYDNAGNIGQSATVAVTVANSAAPTVAISAPANNTTVSGMVAVTATANDDQGVSRVEFYVNGSLQATSSTAPYTFTWDTNSVKDGTYTLSAKAYDTTDNVGQADTTVYVNNAAVLPSGTYSALFGNANGADYPGTIEDTYININSGVNSTSPVLNTYTWPVNTPANAILMKWNLSALPANAQIQSATLYLYQNGSGGDDQYQIPVAEIINKQPVLSASNGYTYDGTNAWTPSSVPYNSIPLAQSDINPAVDAPLIDKAVGYKKWNVTTIIADWVATPGNNRGLLLNSSSAASSDSSREFASSKAVDANLRPRLVVVYTIPDTVVPTVSIDSPSSNATVSGTVSVAATAGDNVAVTKVEFYVNGTLRATSASAPYGFAWDTTQAANGTYALSAKAYDAAGNVGQATAVTVNVANQVADTTAPAVTAFSISASVTTLSVPVITFAATDNVGVTGYLITESAAAPAASSTGWTASVPESYTFTTTGTKTLYAWVKDGAGNVSAAKSATTVISIAKTTSQDVMIVDTATTYPSIQDAYDTMTNSGTIAAKDVVFTSGLDFNRSVDVSLEGGMDSTFQSTSGTTAVSGVIKISNGKVVVNKIVVR